MRAGDDMDRDDLAHAASRFRAGIHRGANRGNVAPEGDRDETRADLVLFNEHHIGRLQRRELREHRIDLLRRDVLAKAQEHQVRDHRYLLDVSRHTLAAATRR
mgnify:CR=1 FL=1